MMFTEAGLGQATDLNLSQTAVSGGRAIGSCQVTGSMGLTARAPASADFQRPAWHLLHAEMHPWDIPACL